MYHFFERFLPMLYFELVYFLVISSSDIVGLPGICRD